jgi:hypothetical protein
MPKWSKRSMLWKERLLHCMGWCTMSQRKNSRNAMSKRWFSSTRSICCYWISIANQFDSYNDYLNAPDAAKIITISTAIITNTNTDILT